MQNMNHGRLGIGNQILIVKAVGADQLLFKTLIILRKISSKNIAFHEPFPSHFHFRNAPGFTPGMNYVIKASYGPEKVDTRRY